MSTTKALAIGKFYNVPCVLLGFPFHREWYPVIGPQHDDAEYIGIAVRHWHYDVRFLTALQLKRLMYAYPGGVEASAMLRLVTEQMLDPTCTKPVLKRKRMARDMPNFPMTDGRNPNPFARKLEAAYADVVLKPDCRTCPHRGMPLDGVPVKDGVVICPGHGLAWDLNTGRMVRRVAEHLRCGVPTPAGSAVTL